MRFRNVSKMLVAAALATGAGAGAGACGARQTDATDTVVTPPVVPRPEGWTHVSILALLDRHAPVPADARGVYVRTPHCTNCIEIVRGPELYGACTETPCAVPMAKDPYADRLLYLTAEGRVQVVPWSALAPVVERLVTERGAAASDDPEIAVLRMLRDGGKLARTDAWVELTADGAFRIADGFPPELRLPVDHGGMQYPPYGEPVDGSTEDPAIARAAAALEERGERVGYQWVVVRPLARGKLVTFGAGGGCAPGGTASVVVDDNGAALVDRTDTGFPDECRPRGRRPEGLASRPDAHADDVARWYAEAMHMEAASVPAFERLAAELAALGAPARLVRAARAAARDEVRHAAQMTRMGARVGASPTEVVVAARSPRSLEQIAIENAVEGCVNEGFAALLCEHQARTASDPAVARAMTSIARDEQTHAGLAFAIATWLDTQLSPAARAAVARAVDAALAALPALAAAEATRYASAAAPLGLPSPSVARAVAVSYTTWLRSEACGLLPDA